MSWKQESPDFRDVVNALMDQYTSQQSAQGERLIGFAIVLFTIIQVIQFSLQSGQKLVSSVFPTIDSLFNNMPSWLTQTLEVWKFLFLSMTIFVLMVFLFRTVFRFAVCGGLSRKVMSVTEADVKQVPDKVKRTVHEAIHTAACMKLSNMRFFGLFPARWFLAAESIEFSERNGWIVCIILGLVTSFSIISLIW